MEQTIIEFVEERTFLDKNSSVEDIRMYFEGILRLYQSNEKFPVDLDEVWMLVYSEKGKAVRALKKSFYEGEDYYLAQNGKVIKSSEIQNGIEIKYHLTVKCLEYFIARKVRAVFDVYREVFRKVATGEVNTQQKSLSSVEMFALQAQINLEQDKRLKSIEERLDKMDEERKHNGRLLLEAQVSGNSVPAMTMRKSIIALVNEYSAATNTSQKDVWHSVYNDLYYRYGKSINSYKRLLSRESKLDIAERNGLLEPIFDIISDMIVKWRGAQK